MNKFFEELKRRNVIKSAIAYLVVAWVLLQVFTVLLPILEAPNWILKGLTLLLAIGLPIWIIVSWVYDITPEGIEKTTENSNNKLANQVTNKRLNVFIIVSLSIAVVVMGLKISNVFEPNTNGKYSIAVMPFVNVSNDVEQEYFSDGISEEIINMLGQVPGLKVIARTSSFSFKGKNQKTKSIGEQLGVSHILEGSVRRSGNKLRITAQLINIADDSQMFSEQFDRELEDVFDIQDEISANILESIKIKLLGDKKEAVFKNYTDDVEAYQLYLQGRYHVNKFTPAGFIKAIKYFDAAIALEPEYAIAYAGLTFCYTNLLDFNWLASEDSLPIAIEAAEKSLQLDDKIFESHLAVGRIQLHQEWNIKAAMTSFKKALAINPNSAETHIQLGMCLSLYGQCEEAMEHSRIAESLDPLSILNIFYLTVPILVCHNYETVLANGAKLIDLEPKFFSGHMWAGAGYFGLGQYDEAIEELKLSVQLNPGTWTLGYLGFTYGFKGDTLKAREVIERIKATKGYERFANNSLALVYFSIGESETALTYMERALENREGQLLWTKNWIESHVPETLQNPRAIQIIEKMGAIY
jgi:serine/threonine-protein kinase